MNRRLAIFGLGLITALFLGGLARLFTLRFAGGDLYPPGSSRRADPQGTKAFHDSLAELSTLRVERNYESLSRLAPIPAGSTVLLLGYDPDLLPRAVPSAVAGDLDDFVREGGRLVLALAYRHPASATNPWAGIRRRLKQGGEEASEKAARRLPDMWGFELAQGTGASGEALHDGSVAGLPPRLTWPGVHRFTNPHDAWRVQYARDGEAVVMERPLGRGTLVLLADDFLVSNEALRHRREPAFLAWLIGPSRRVIFDETHLGLRQDPGLASLIRRYRLGGATIGLLILAGLFGWQQASPFLPRQRPVSAGQGGEVGPIVQGRDTAAGFRNLLTRAVPPHLLVPTLYQLWATTAGRRRPVEQPRDAQDCLNLDSARPSADRDPLALYHQIARILNPKR